MNEKLRALVPSKRRFVQLYTALLYNANLTGFAEGTIYQGPTKNVCVPGLNCYSCPGAVGACPLGAFQNALSASAVRFPYYMLGTLLLFGSLFGRVICGFLCPVGLVQELLHKIPTPKIPKSRFTRALSLLKYVILAVFVIAIPLHYAAREIPLPGFCKFICPAGIGEGAIGLLSHPRNSNLFNMLSILFTRKFVILILFIGFSVFMFRPFCRFICPLGAIYSLFNRISFFGVRVDLSKCTHCSRCIRECGMDVKEVGDRECIQCASCMNVCAANAISLKAGKWTIMDPCKGLTEPLAADGGQAALTLKAGPDGSNHLTIQSSSPAAMTGQEDADRENQNQ